MNLPPRVLQRVADMRNVLGLPPEAAPVLSVFMLLDTDKDVAQQARQDDDQGRLGVITWSRLTQLLPPEDGDISRLELVVGLLADWGILQVVGRSASDPVLPGSSALRLTYFGRVCAGLAPTALHGQLGLEQREIPPPTEASTPWRVWHSASRETLLLASEELVGDAAFRPIAFDLDSPDVDRLAGRISQALCEDHGVVLDAFGMTSMKKAAQLEELLRRTRAARTPRILVIGNPSFARIAALGVGAELEWKEPHMHGRKETGRFDQRMTDRLRGDRRSVADVCGVPDTDLAVPRRVSTSWDDLMLPAPVRAQLDHALMHAHFRLSVIHDRVRIPGKNTGYRLILSGLPGTGKSMAAEALASLLDKPVVKLDLSSVLSKWLGETEKLLAQVFEVAEASGSILVLDEAEALFRQRDGGSGGRDGLGTVVAYLLARLDRFEGVLVATTNRTKDLDEAFFRRFDDYVVLPVPNEETRERLWRLMLRCGIPHTEDGGPDAVEADFSEVDFHYVARQFAITGGLIRNAAVRAVAWAEGLSRPIDTAVVLASLARELEKNDRSNAMAFNEPYRKEVQQLLGAAGAFSSPT